MTANEFRNLALALPEAEESAHMGHPDFRVRKKIFATMGRVDQGWCMVKLSPDQQKTFVRTSPKMFQPVPGGWGRQGCTQVILETADEPSVRQALIVAWRNTAPKKLSEQFDDEELLQR